MGVIKKIKLFLGIFIPFFAIFVMSQNTFAASIGPAEFGLSYRGYNSAQYNWQLGLYAGPNYYVEGWGLNGVRIQWQSLTYQGNHASIHSEINVVSWESGTFQRNQWVNLPYQSVYACSNSAGTAKIEQSNVNTAITNWTGPDGSARSTLTLYVDIALSGLGSGDTGSLACLVGSQSYAFASNTSATNSRYYIEQAPSTIEFSNNINDVLLQTQINQNNSMIYNQNMMIDQNKQINTNIVEGFDQLHNDQQNASDNIGGQDTGDIDGATNQQTTTLIGILSNFVTTITNVQATSYCSFTLRFPAFAGGNQRADLCQGRQDQIINIFSSVVLVTFFIPLAYLLLKMIYNEIRSWTNG